MDMAAADLCLYDRSACTTEDNPASSIKAAIPLDALPSQVEKMPGGTERKPSLMRLRFVRFALKIRPADRANSVSEDKSLGWHREKGAKRLGSAHYFISAMHHLPMESLKLCNQSN